MLRPNFSHPLIQILVVLILFVPSTWAHDDGLGDHVLQAYRLEQEPPPKIDGKLDDPVWQQATPISGFIQLRPDRTKPATEDTEVRLA